MTSPSTAPACPRSPSPACGGTTTPIPGTPTSTPTTRSCSTISGPTQHWWRCSSTSRARIQRRSPASSWIWRRAPTRSCAPTTARRRWPHRSARGRRAARLLAPRDRGSDMRPVRTKPRPRLVTLRQVALAALASLLFAQSADAQRSAAGPAWPAVTTESRPWTRWWWHGSAVNPVDLTKNLEAYQRVGLGGVEITPIYGVFGAEQEFIPYLSPKWVSMLEHTLTESTRLGLGVDMATGTGWPFGGPTVGDADAAKYVAWKRWTLKGGERRRDTITFVQAPLVRAVSGRGDIAALKDPIATTPNLQALA